MPSGAVTLSVIVAVPTPPAGVTLSALVAPLPLRLMPLFAATDWSDDVARHRQRARGVGGCRRTVRLSVGLVGSPSAAGSPA